MYIAASIDKAQAEVLYFFHQFTTFPVFCIRWSKNFYLSLGFIHVSDVYTLLYDCSLYVSGQAMLW